MGELKFYLEEIAGYQLSPAGEELYQRVHDFLYTNGSWFQGRLAQKTGFSDTALSLSADLQLNPETYYKSNPNIGWSHRYYLVDNLLTVPVQVGISDYLSFGMDVFLGMNYAGVQRADNLSNIPIAADDFQQGVELALAFTYNLNPVRFWRWATNLTDHGPLIIV